MLTLPEVMIRLIKQQDREALARFFHRNNLEEVTQYFHPFPLNDESARMICCAGNLDRFLGTFDGEKLVGLAMLRGWDKGFAMPSLGVLVDVAYRRLGRGRRLVQEAISEGKRSKATGIILSVYASNWVAVRLYSSLGFKQTNRGPVYVNGRLDWKIRMCLGL